MEEEELQKAVPAYLRKKGFRQAELAFQEEQNRLSSSALSDLAVSRFDNDPARYNDGYSKLRSWAYSSLDLYKLGHFFHTFREDHELMHLRDLQKLEGILSPLHLEEMELARSLRQN